MERPPDIVFVMTDEHRHDWLGHTSDGLFHTPNLDRLAADGVSFTDAYSAATVCVPARSALLTGVHHARTTMVEGALALRPGFWTIAHEMRAAGYQTALIGRMHFTPVHADHGFDVMRICENVNPGSGYDLDGPALDDYQQWLREEGYPDLRIVDLDEHGEPRPFIAGMPRAFPVDAAYHPTSWIEREAVSLLRSRDRTKPLFLMVSFPHPHAPYDPPEPYWSMYDPADTVLPDDGFEVNDVLYGGFRLGLDQFRSHAWSQRPGGADLMRRVLASIRALVHQIDDSVGRILDEVDRSSSLLFFTADHGDYGGHRGLSTKLPWLPFDDLIRVPLIVSGGAVRTAPRVSGAPVQSSSFAATCLDYAGIPVGDGVLDFPSLRPLLDGDDAAIDADTPRISLWGWPVVRRGPLKMVFEIMREQHLLFDLSRDPGETVSFHDDPDYQDAKAELWQIMATEIVKGVDPDLAAGVLRR